MIRIFINRFSPLAKNQISDKGAEPIVIHAISQDDNSSKYLFPIRKLKIHINRTHS